MDKKLTLSLNGNIIENAKLYAKSNNTSLSKLIESHLGTLTKKEKWNYPFGEKSERCYFNRWWFGYKRWVYTIFNEKIQMKKILIDTNIVIDLLSKRKWFYDDAAALFSQADKKELNLNISSLTFANTNYIISKLKSAKEARAILRKFKVLVEILSLNDKITELALSDESFRNFEDGLQYYSAIENEIDLIITRNKKDFKNAKLPVLTAKEYLDSVS